MDLKYRNLIMRVKPFHKMNCMGLGMDINAMQLEKTHSAD